MSLRANAVSAAIPCDRINVIASEYALRPCHCEGIYARGNPSHGADKVAVPFSCRGLPRSRCSLAMTSKPLLLPVIASGVAAAQSHARETNVSIIVSVQHTYVNYIYNF